MARGLQAEIEALGNEVRATAISDGCKHTADWCLKQLPSLYAKFGQTNESRYGDEISSLLKAVLKELGKGSPPCPNAKRLTMNLVDRVQLLHERLGLPRLGIIIPSAPPPGARKGRQTPLPS